MPAAVLLDEGKIAAEHSLDETGTLRPALAALGALYGAWIDVGVCMDAIRFAIYFTPTADSALWRFGCGVIGYDAARGVDVPDQQRDTLGGLLGAAQVAQPARYGFHATLCAPFSAATGVGRADVLASAKVLAAALMPVRLGRLRVARMDGFLALVPAADCPSLNAMAADCVRHFDALRAPLSAADRARRVEARLTPRQIALLDRWGYPFVFEEFRFHMTLTGTLAATALELIEPALSDAYAHIDEPVMIDAISVLEQPTRKAPFRIVSRLPLRTC